MVDAAPDGGDGQDHPVRDPGRAARALPRRARRWAAAAGGAVPAVARPADPDRAARASPPRCWTRPCGSRASASPPSAASSSARPAARTTPPPLAAAVRAAMAEGCDMLLIAGASAITDRHDVLPAGIVAAGGTLEHFGMPVDPGNLLLLARLDGRPVLGLPGCCRSPKLNGLDWVLQRLAAGIEVTGRGHHGHGRGRPADRDPVAPAAARGRAASAAPARAGGPGPGRRPVAAHGRPQQAAPRGRRQADGPPRRRGGAGLARGPGGGRARPPAARGPPGPARPQGPLRRTTPTTRRASAPPCGPASPRCRPTSAGAVVCLGDMPRVSAALIDRLIAAFDPVEGRGDRRADLARQARQPGALWARAFFAEMQTVAGDVGARHLIGEHAGARGRGRGRERRGR